MATYTYTRTSPNANIAPRNDQPTMLQNAQSIADLIAEDHIGFNTPNGGYHKTIHQLPQTDPVTISGVGQTYVKTIDGDQQLFYKSGNGVITQLTAVGADTSMGSPNFGYASLTGGFIIQWGFINLQTPDPNPYLFTAPNIVFPNRCANVSLTVNFPGISASQATAMVIGNPTTTGFSWQLLTGSSQNKFIYWTAIGY